MHQALARATLPSTLFISAMTITAVMNLWTEALLLKIALSVLLGLFLVGGLEAVHQATHYNLFERTWLNKWVGGTLALVLLLNFIRYRAFHAYHHAHTATRNDPERVLYLNSDGRGLKALLLAPIGFIGFALTIQRSRFVSARMRGIAVLNSLMLGLFITIALFLTALYPIEMVLVYWIPLCLFTWFDFLLNQAEHYGMTELVPGSDPAAATNNLLLPRPLAVLFLYRNLHRVHHIAPRTAWHKTESVFREQGDPGMPFWRFFRRYWAEGPRLWGIR